MSSWRRASPCPLKSPGGSGSFLWVAQPLHPLFSWQTGKGRGRGSFRSFLGARLGTGGYPIFISFSGKNTHMCKSMGSLGASQVVLMVKNPPLHAGNMRDVGSVPGSGRPPGGGHGNPAQCSCLENPTERGACRLQPMGSHRDGHERRS